MYLPALVIMHVQMHFKADGSTERQPGGVFLDFRFLVLVIVFLNKLFVHLCQLGS